MIGAGSFRSGSLDYTLADTPLKNIEVIRKHAQLLILDLET
jgi:hypothetical protein